MESQGYANLPPGLCVSSMGRPVSYEQATVWKVLDDNESNHCLAFILVNWSFVWRMDYKIMLDIKVRMLFGPKVCEIRGSQLLCVIWSNVMLLSSLYQSWHYVMWQDIYVVLCVINVWLVSLSIFFGKIYLAYELLFSFKYWVQSTFIIVFRYNKLLPTKPFVEETNNSFFVFAKLFYTFGIYFVSMRK